MAQIKTQNQSLKICFSLKMTEHTRIVMKNSHEKSNDNNNYVFDRSCILINTLSNAL